MQPAFPPLIQLSCALFERYSIKMAPPFNLSENNLANINNNFKRLHICNHVHRLNLAKLSRASGRLTFILFNRTYTITDSIFLHLLGHSFFLKFSF